MLSDGTWNLCETSLHAVFVHSMASSVPWADQQTHFWEWWSSILEPENKDEEALNISHYLPAWNNHSDCLRVSPSDVHITVALRQLRNLSFVIKMICRTHWIAQVERDTALVTNVLYLSQVHLDLVWKICESLSPIQFNCQKCQKGSGSTPVIDI